MVIDLDRCNGCGTCMVACAVENNVPPARADSERRTGITWMRVYKVDNGASFPESTAVFVPVIVPAVRTSTRPASRYARRMPWTSTRRQESSARCRSVPRLPLLHDGLSLSRALLQLVGSRLARGHGEDAEPGCFAPDEGRRGEVQFLSRPAARGTGQSGRRRATRIEPDEYMPACVEACPTRGHRLRRSGRSSSEVAQLAQAKDAFRLLADLGTEPKVYYLSKKPWVHKLAKHGARGRQRRRLMDKH